MSNDKDYTTVGSTEFVEIAGIKEIPAKIDTGADTSSIWASNIDMGKDGTLSFVLFDKKSPFYTGEKMSSKEYVVKTVRSSHGDEQIRYRVKLPLTLGNKTFITTFTLANRSRLNFPVLIGRHTLKNNYLVDVSKSSVKRTSNPHTPNLNKELQEDPYKFHRKYLKK
jgi:hypothetical protein